jgi:hypothetical protein
LFFLSRLIEDKGFPGGFSDAYALMREAILGEEVGTTGLVMTSQVFLSSE